MKRIVVFLGVLLLITLAGCKMEESEHSGPAGGAYDGYYQDYGHSKWDDPHQHEHEAQWH
jgi:hypothetical protein